MSQHSQRGDTQRELLAVANQGEKNGLYLIDTMRQHGFSDAEIFDIATATAARRFFSKTLDALGAEPDEDYLSLDENLRKALTFGRPFAGKPKLELSRSLIDTQAVVRHAIYIGRLVYQAILCRVRRTSS